MRSDYRVRRFSWLRMSAMAVLAVSLCGAISKAQSATPDDASPWHLTLDIAAMYGSADGYAQTPSGGEPGTTSHHRPTFAELGIDDEWMGDASATLWWHDEGVYAGAQILRLSGDSTLGTTLVSHGETFPAGSSVSGDVTLDWYRFGYRHRFAFLEDRSLSVSPGIGVAILNFDDDVSESGGISTSRSYIKTAVQLSVDAEWRPRGGPFSLELSLFATPGQISSMPAIYSEELLAKYRVIDRPRFELTPFVGVEFEQIRFEDNQTVPNRIHADLGPLVVVGLEFSF